MRLFRLSIVVLALIVSSCSGSPAAPTTDSTFVPSIFFTGGSSLMVGQAVQLAATERLTSSTTQDVTSASTWQSSNPAVATVSGAGLVTAASLGSAVITATSQSVAGTLLVSVVANTVRSILVVGPNTLAIGQTSALSAAASTTTSGIQVVTGGVAWLSSKPDVASVSSDGVLTATAPGTTTISATYAGVTGSLTVTVVNLVATSIAFFGPTTVTSGTPTQLMATAMFADGTAQIITNVATWQSSNAGAATVSSSGLVTWVAIGTTTITASYLGITGSVVMSAN
jgi:uncharacterized protein YjdB